MAKEKGKKTNLESRVAENKVESDKAKIKMTFLRKPKDTAAGGAESSASTEALAKRSTICDVKAIADGEDGDDRMGGEGGGVVSRPCTHIPLCSPGGRDR